MFWKYTVRNAAGQKRTITVKELLALEIRISNYLLVGPSSLQWMRRYFRSLLRRSRLCPQSVRLSVSILLLGIPKAALFRVYSKRCFKQQGTIIGPLWRREKSPYAMLWVACDLIVLQTAPFKKLFKAHVSPVCDIIAMLTDNRGFWLGFSDSALQNSSCEQSNLESYWMAYRSENPYCWP